MTKPDPAAVEHLDALTSALTVLAEQRQLPPCCADPTTSGLWLSEDAKERAEAARSCHGCPVLKLCGAAAQAGAERFGVWGGRDRSPQTSRRKAAA